MAKIQDYLRHAADLLEIATTALDLISRVTKTTTDDRAVIALRTIAAVVDTARGGFGGKVTPAQARHDLSSLQASLASNDDDIDKALKARFP